MDYFSEFDKRVEETSQRVLSLSADYKDLSRAIDKGEFAKDGATAANAIKKHPPLVHRGEDVLNCQSSGSHGWIALVADDHHDQDFLPLVELVKEDGIVLERHGLLGQTGRARQSQVVLEGHIE